MIAFLLAAAGGLAIAAAGAPREWPATAWLGMPLLLLAVERTGGGRGARPFRPSPRPRRAFFCGLLFGTVANAIALGWVVQLLEVFASFPTIASVPTALLLWVAQALAFAFAAAGAAVLIREGAPGWLVVPACVIVASTLTPALFPWRIAGTQIPWTAFVQIAELGGEPLVDLALAVGSCGLLEAIRTDVRRRAPLFAGALAVVLPLGWGAIRLPMVRAEREEARLLRVGVVQPNIGIFAKHDPDRWPDHLQLLRRMTADLEDRGAGVVVWPETAYPFPWPRRRRADMAGELAVRSEGVRGPVLFGAITRTDYMHRWNSAIALEADGSVVGIADKVELLAFGEYVPFWHWLPPLQKAFRTPGLTPGDEPRILELAGAKIAVLNCYEDVLPRFARMVARRDPDLLVNVTNDAWFGDTAEPHLHHHVARMRAIETRRDLVRAVNTGVSAHVLATGEDAVRTPTWERRSFIAEARLLDGTTLWVVLGDFVTPVCQAWLIALVILARLRRRR